MLERIIRAIKQRCPRDTIVVRGDPAFALPRLMDRLEQLSAELDDVHYGLGLAQDPLLLALAAPLLAEAAAGHDTTQHFVRRFTWPSYAAQTWAHPRDVILEVEHGERGPNPASSSRRSPASTRDGSTTARHARAARARATSGTSRTRSPPTGGRAIAAPPARSG